MPYIIQNAEIEIHLFLYKDVLEHEKVIDQPTHSIQQKKYGAKEFLKCRNLEIMKKTRDQSDGRTLQPSSQRKLSAEKVKK